MLEKASKFKVRQVEDTFGKYLMKRDFEDSKVMLKQRIDLLAEGMDGYEKEG